MENGLRWKITNDRRTNENEKNFMADYIFHFAYSGVYQDCILDGEEFLIGEGEKMSRYIDADKVLEKINKICNRCGKMNVNNGALCGACYFDDAKDIIDDFPTEEVRPDISGEWIPVVDDEGFVTKHKCSKCNAIGFRSMNFCPECGSRNFRRKEKMSQEVTQQFAIDYLLDDCEDCPEYKDGECVTESHCFEVKQMCIKALRGELKGGNK